MSMIRLALALIFLGLGAASAQAASPCAAPAPAEGVELHGPVLHVLDGQTLCVAQGSDPSLWAPVRLADAPTGTSWGALMSVAFAKDVTCVVHRGAAVCRIDGEPIGARLDSTAAKAGVAWRRPAGRADGVNAQMRIADAGR